MQNLWITPEELPSEYATSTFASEACSSASFILWALSGRKYSGVTTVTETYECPCVPVRNVAELFSSHLEQFAGVRDGCSCGGRTRLRLRGTPVIEISQVTRGTEIVPASTYTLQDRSVLQISSMAARTTCGLTVTYVYGRRPPVMGTRAAAELATEFIKDWDPEQGDCQLPDRVSSVSRQGVSYTILDDQSYLNDLRTGLYSIDLFLRATNPVKALKRAKVFSPDVPRGTRRTGTGTLQPVGPNDVVLSRTGDATWTRLLSEIGAGLLLSPEEWRPIIQVSGAHGAILLEVPESQVVVNADAQTLSVTFTQAQCRSIASTATLDLYAESSRGLAHVLTSSVRPANTVGA